MDRRVQEVVRILLQTTRSAASPSSVLPGDWHTANDVEGNRLKDKLFVEQMAQLVNLSPSRLRALFRAEIETTPKRRIKQLKLEQAKRLAEETYLTINEILSAVEASDPRHFRKDFKKAYGMTLTECRNRQRQSFLERDVIRDME